MAILPVIIHIPYVSANLMKDGNLEPLTLANNTAVAAPNPELHPVMRATYFGASTVALASAKDAILLWCLWLLLPIGCCLDCSMIVQSCEFYADHHRGSSAHSPGRAPGVIGY